MSSDKPTEQELKEQRLAEVIRYAQRVLGSEASQRSSQRALAERLGCAPTMVTRYLAGNVEFGNLRAETVRALAEAAKLHVGTVFVWIEQGRDAAMAYEQRMAVEPVAFEPLDLARQLVRLLEAATTKEKRAPEERGLDVKGLMALLDDARAESPRIFDRMVRALAAEPMLQRLVMGELDGDEDWALLAELLDAEVIKLQEAYGDRRSQAPQALPPADESPQPPAVERSARTPGRTA